MESSSLPNIGDMRNKRHGLKKLRQYFSDDGAVDTLLLSMQIEFRVSLRRREDEITNNSDLSPLNFRLLSAVARGGARWVRAPPVFLLKGKSRPV